MTPINIGTSDSNVSTGCDITKTRIIGVYLKISSVYKWLVFKLNLYQGNVSVVI
jgi:hypothetical protein